MVGGGFSCLFKDLKKYHSFSKKRLLFKHLSLIYLSPSLISPFGVPFLKVI